MNMRYAKRSEDTDENFSDDDAEGVTLSLQV